MKSYKLGTKLKLVDLIVMSMILVLIIFANLKKLRLAGIIKTTYMIPKTGICIGFL